MQNIATDQPTIEHRQSQIQRAEGNNRLLH